jgi:hypothetical protein
VLEAASSLQKQLVVRTTLPNAGGMGSVVAQLRSSVALATMLNADFATVPVASAHSTGYRSASLLAIDRLPYQLSADTTVCSVSATMGQQQVMDLINDWCPATRHDPERAETRATEIRPYFTGCGVILDDRPWDARYDMSVCTWKWVRRTCENVGFRDRNDGIGIHIRWGDMFISPNEGDPLTRLRSTPIDVAAHLLRKLRSCGIRDELTVYMELHNTTMLEGLGEPYHIVDSGDSLADLLDLAANKIMVLDLSSYTVLAHQTANGGLTIIPDEDGFGIDWYDNGLNQVLRWGEVLSAPCAEIYSAIGQ